jgi:hypothetical protein
MNVRRLVKPPGVAGTVRGPDRFARLEHRGDGTTLDDDEKSA